MDEIQAQSIPETILKQKTAINLYLIAVAALAAIGVLAVVGALILAWGGRTVPGEFWTVAGIAIGGLVAMVGQGQSQ